MLLTNLDKLPKKALEHWLWGDYIELHCLCNPDRLITNSDLYGIIRQNLDNNVDSDELSNDEPEVFNDSLMSKINERFDYLSNRSLFFLEKYPFDIKSIGETKILSLKNESALSVFYPYIFMLLSSGLKYHESDVFHTITNLFEVVSVNVLKKLLKENAEVLLFSRQNPKLPTKAWDKIQWLAKRLEMTVLADEQEFNRNIAGEGGLDAVAWYKMGDNLPNRPLFFIQCACSSNDWPKKILDSSYGRWNKILSFSNPPINLMFIPYSYRNMESAWVKHYELGDAILFDRKRILEYFTDVEILTKEIIIKNFFEKLNS